jgi:hypothetical protein
MLAENVHLETHYFRICFILIPIPNNLLAGDDDRRGDVLRRDCRLLMAYSAGNCRGNSRVPLA